MLFVKVEGHIKRLMMKRKIPGQRNDEGDARARNRESAWRDFFTV